MAEALSVDLRRRVLDAALDGASCGAVAARVDDPLGAAVPRARRSHAGQARRRHRARRIASHRNLVLAVVAAEPAPTLADIAERLEATTGDRPRPGVADRLLEVVPRIRAVGYA